MVADQVGREQCCLTINCSVTLSLCSGCWWYKGMFSSGAVPLISTRGTSMWPNSPAVNTGWEGVHTKIGMNVLFVQISLCLCQFIQTRTLPCFSPMVHQFMWLMLRRPLLHLFVCFPLRSYDYIIVLYKELLIIHHFNLFWRTTTNKKKPKKIHLKLKVK